MVDREPTTGELQVQLEAIQHLLETMAKSMVTRDLFDAWRDGNNERLKALEGSHQRWVQDSTAQHVTLEKDSKARHEESRTEMDKAKASLRSEADRNKASLVSELATLRAEFEAERKNIASVKNTRTNLWIAAGLTISATLIINILRPLIGG